MNEVKHAPMTIAAALIVLSLTACGQASSYPREQSVSDPQTATPVVQARYTLRLVQTIRDESAYTAYRGIYILNDTQTGREWIGVSGIGISELGSHQSGKTRASDER